MYRLLSRILPRAVRNNYASLLRYNDVLVEPERFIGFLFFVGLGLSILLALYTSAIFNVSFWLSIIIYFIILEVAFYFYFLLRADAKGRFVEFVLPDALQLMASNLRAGFTTDRALLLAARTEFGIFQIELNRLGKELTVGKDMGIALLDMSKRIKSDKLEKTVFLIVSGIKSGGELAPILEQSAENLRNKKLIEDKTRSNILMYIIFIFFAIAFGAPLLFGLSSFLVDTLSKILSEVEMPVIPSGITLPLMMTELAASPSFVFNFILLSLTTISIFGGLVLGLVIKGKEKEGLKYIPILLVLSLGVFFLTRFVIKIVFANIFAVS